MDRSSHKDSHRPNWGSARPLGNWRRFSLLVTLTVALSLSARAAYADLGVDRDCGSSALFVILELEGKHVSLDELDAVLPTRHPNGYSLEELARASKRLGLELDGRQLNIGDALLKRPVIAFSKSPSGGHFSVLRPVGTTGTMVQVIDPPHPTRIVDYSELVRMPTWTGRVLQPAPPWPIRHAPSLLAGAASLVALGAAADWWRRRSRAGSRSPGETADSDGLA